MLDITSDKELKQGQNLLKVNLKHKEHNVVNANVKLILKKITIKKFHINLQKLII